MTFGVSARTGSSSSLRALPLLALLASALARPQAVVWLYAPQATPENGLWQQWAGALEAHRDNLTGVAPCIYLIGGDGVFSDQMGNASNLAAARNATLSFKRDMGLDTVPLLAASGTGMNLILRDAALAQRAIDATVAEAVALNLSGYNLQLEEPGSPEIQANWTIFLTKWLAALDNVGSTLAVIIGGDCRARDWMWMDCGNYREMYAAGSTNLRVITEATYEQNPPTWKDFLANIVRGLGPEIAQLGYEYGPPSNNPDNGCLPAAAAANVSTMYLWVNPPESNASWDGMGWWLSHAFPSPSSSPSLSSSSSLPSSLS